MQICAYRCLFVLVINISAIYNFFYLNRKGYVKSNIKLIRASMVLSFKLYVLYELKYN